MMRFKEKFNKVVVAEMMKKFGYKSRMAVPRVKKVIVNTGFGRLVMNKTKQEKEKIYEDIISDLSLITGQKPVLTKARSSISSFKIRTGMPIGAKITLRGEKMNDFLDRMINIALPRIGDFKGLDPKSVDKGGNLTIGIKEQIIFPEVSAENIRRIFSFEITVVTNAKHREEALELYNLLGFPIKS